MGFCAKKLEGSIKNRMDQEIITIIHPMKWIDYKTNKLLRVQAKIESKGSVGEKSVEGLFAYINSSLDSRKISPINWDIFSGKLFNKIYT